jgi:hypothetical protein
MVSENLINARAAIYYLSRLIFSLNQEYLKARRFSENIEFGNKNFKVLEQRLEFFMQTNYRVVDEKIGRYITMTVRQNIMKKIRGTGSFYPKSGKYHISQPILLDDSVSDHEADKIKNKAEELTRNVEETMRIYLEELAGIKRELEEQDKQLTGEGLLQDTSSVMLTAGEKSPKRLVTPKMNEAKWAVDRLNCVGDIYKQEYEDIFRAIKQELKQADSHGKAGDPYKQLEEKSGALFLQAEVTVKEMLPGIIRENLNNLVFEGSRKLRFMKRRALYSPDPRYLISDDDAGEITGKAYASVKRVKQEMKRWMQDIKGELISIKKEIEKLNQQSTATGSSSAIPPKGRAGSPRPAAAGGKELLDPVSARSCGSSPPRGS